MTFVIKIVLGSLFKKLNLANLETVKNLTADLNFGLVGDRLSVQI